MEEIDYNEIRKGLIRIYKAYTNGEITEDIRNLAEKLYSRCLSANPILPENLAEAVGPLDGIAWPKIIEKTERPVLSKERAKSILENLQKEE